MGPRLHFGGEALVLIHPEWLDLNGSTAYYLTRIGTIGTNTCFMKRYQYAKQSLVLAMGLAAALPLTACRSAYRQPAQSEHSTQTQQQQSEHPSSDHPTAEHPK